MKNAREGVDLGYNGILSMGGGGGGNNENLCHLMPGKPDMNAGTDETHFTFYFDIEPFSGLQLVVFKTLLNP